MSDRPTLLSRLTAARTVALSKNRQDYVAACDLLIKAVRRAFDEEVQHYETAVLYAERDCASAKTLAELRAARDARLARYMPGLSEFNSKLAGVVL